MSAGELARYGTLLMAEGKYGRLFTEREVRGLVVSAAADGELGAHRDGDATPDEYATRLIGQMTAPTFPPDEPLFLLRGQDKAAPRAIATESEYEEEYGGYGDYYSAALVVGADEPHLDAVSRAAAEMYRWQREHPDRVKVPD